MADVTLMSMNRPPNPKGNPLKRIISKGLTFPVYMPFTVTFPNDNRWITPRHDM